METDAALFDWIVLQTGHVTRGTVTIKHDVDILQPDVMRARLRERGWRVTIFASTGEISLYKPTPYCVGNPKSEVSLQYRSTPQSPSQ